MARVRDAFATLIFTAGALLPTQADIHALKEYVENEPHRAELKAQVAALQASGQPVPEGMEKNANGSSFYNERVGRYAKALTNLPEEAHTALMARAQSDKAERDQATATALELRVRSLQIQDPPVPVELENGVMKRRDPARGTLRLADPNTGEFLPEPEGEPEKPAEPVTPEAPETNETTA